MSDEVDALDRLVERARRGHVLDNRPFELTLLELVRMLLLPGVGLVLRADSPADAVRGEEARNTTRISPRLRALVPQ